MDDIAIRKGHTYRIVFSDLDRGRPIWFGGKDRSEASMSQFYAWLGKRKSSRIRLAVMDMWKPFRLATAAHAPQAAILFAKFHVIPHLGDASDAARAEYTLRRDRLHRARNNLAVSRRENLTPTVKALKTLFAANRRLIAAYVLKESFANCELRCEGCTVAVLRELAFEPQVAAPQAMRSSPLWIDRH